MRISKLEFIQLWNNADSPKALAKKLKTDAMRLSQRAYELRKQGYYLKKFTLTDKEYFRQIGRKGGQVKSPHKGFGGNRELASRAGKIGGSRSRIS